MQAPKKSVGDRDLPRAKAKLAVPPPPAPAIDQAAIAEGRKPLSARRQETDQLGARTAELYGIGDVGFKPLTQIEAGFKFVAADSDIDFQYLHAELLLDRAAAQLDSCLALRAKRDAVMLEKWKLQLELDSFFRQTQLEDQEREAGLATLSYERAMLDAAAEQAFAEYQKDADSQISGLMDDLFASGFNKRATARELSAWIAAYPLKDNDLRGDNASYAFDGARRTKPDHLFEAARLESEQAAWEQICVLMSQRLAAISHSEAARLRQASLALEAKWSLGDIHWSTQRAVIARDTTWEKVYQAQSPAGLLNYQRQVEQLDRRFSAEFRDLLACLAAARRGLKELYDYAAPFPEENSPNYLDEVVHWTRLAKNRMTQWSLSDQHYVLALSLKELTQSAWDSGLQSSTWAFDLGPQTFADQTHVRLRGLSLAVVTTDDSSTGDRPKREKPAGGKKPGAPAGGFWSARVSLPPRATLQTMGGASRELDQKSIPVCHFGRVADRDETQPVDIAGANILYNASPIGPGWKVTLSQKSTDGATSESLQDVQIYLHLAVR